MNSLREIGLKTSLNALYWSRAHRLFGPMTEGAGAILMFHHVRPLHAGRFRPHPHLEVTPTFLRAVVQHIRGRGIDIVAMDEAVRRLAEPGAGRFVVLTFDDGYRNNFTRAYPMLKELGAPFTVYVATGLVDRIASPWWDAVGAIVAQNRHVRLAVGSRTLDFATVTATQKEAACRSVMAALADLSEDEMRAVVDRAARDHGVDGAAMLDEVMMDWDEVRALAADPLVTVGAHTVGHYALARLDAGRARREMEESRRRIAAMTGKTPRHFAYPYGSARTAGTREFALSREIGFTTAVTTRRGVLKSGSDLAALPRISVNGGYQAVRYLDLFLSGVPYALERGVNRIRRLSAMPGATEASASTL